MWRGHLAREALCRADIPVRHVPDLFSTLEQRFVILRLRALSSQGHYSHAPASEAVRVLTSFASWTQPVRIPGAFQSASLLQEIRACARQQSNRHRPPARKSGAARIPPAARKFLASSMASYLELTRRNSEFADNLSARILYISIHSKGEYFQTASDGHKFTTLQATVRFVGICQCHRDVCGGTRKFHLGAS